MINAETRRFVEQSLKDYDSKIKDQAKIILDLEERVKVLEATP